ncbi:MAG TPA: hypothetical protein VFW75_14255 [Acetobacteraceae bacterium]|nr:hypothetical protein [Acetobacteraceae bacterium]
MEDLHESGQVLFIAIATGQAAANLPPILEMAHPDDQVLWLESDAARRGKWVDGPRTVLAGRRIHSRDPVSVTDEPAGVAAAVLQCLAECRECRPVFVHNGGTKLASLILDRASGTTPRPILYGLERPAELWIFPAGIDGPLEKRAYTRARLSLPEVLRCSGHAIRNLRSDRPAGFGRNRTISTPTVTRSIP